MSDLDVVGLLHGVDGGALAHADGAAPCVEEGHPRESYLALVAPVAQQLQPHAPKQPTLHLTFMLLRHVTLWQDN